MSTPLIIAALWVLAATAVAFLPMRHQFAPGLVLLVAAPVLIAWIGVVHGWLWVALATAGFVSMFRRPLMHLWRKVSGHA
ncbi:MAG: DUF2484 family protein [Pseudomonadota bacterium]